MRCLFLPDELSAFRPVAMAIRELQLPFVMLRNFDLVPGTIARLDFTLVIACVSNADSDVLAGLRRWHFGSIPVLGVTRPPFRDELLAAGADRVVLLPDRGGHLVTAMRELLKQSTH
jgi:hypothetical protein